MNSLKVKKKIAFKLVGWMIVVKRLFLFLFIKMFMGGQKIRGWLFCGDRVMICVLGLYVLGIFGVGIVS